MGGGNLRERGVGTLQVAGEGVEIGFAMEKKSGPLRKYLAIFCYI